MSHSSLLATLLFCSTLAACVEVNKDEGNSPSEPDNGNPTDSNLPDNNEPQTWPDLIPAGQQEYTEQWLINMDNASLSAQGHSDTLVGETMSQSFILRSPHPVEKNVQLSHLFFKQYFWTGADSDVQFSIVDQDTQTVLLKQAFQLAPMDPRSGIVKPDGSHALKLVEPLALELDKTYVMQFQVNRAENPLSLYHTTQDYVDGTNNQGEDLWFKAMGRGQWLNYDAITIKSDEQNPLIFDPGWATPLKAKMLNLLGESETLWIEKAHNNLNLTYKVANPNMASLLVSQELKPLQGQLSLQGLKTGNTYLNIYHNQQLIEQVELQISQHQTLALSYTYIAYPGETDHNKMRSFERVKADFAKIYQPLNIQLNWTNNGVIEFDWDLNGDGQSYSQEYDEMHAPMSHNILPNMQDYFTNVYLFRIDKNDETYRGCNGGGSSFVSQDNKAPRIAFKSVHVPQDLGCIAPTLMHELAHNLGLSHYSAANSDYLPVENERLNLMKTGRDENQVFAFQWKIIHQTLQDLSTQGKL